MVKGCNLVKEYNSSKIIDGIDIDISEGEFVLITGKSGSGKSTLLYLLSGLEKPTDGEVYINDVNINLLSDEKISKYRRTKIGFIFQFYNLIPALTVKENIILPLKIDHKVTIKEKELFDYIVKDLQLEELLNHYPEMLSGGQQQRVAIARSLIINPDVIFADEPTGNLDSENGEIVMNLFAKMNKQYNKTIVMVTHDQTLVDAFGTRNVVIKNGRAI